MKISNELVPPLPRCMHGHDGWIAQVRQDGWWTIITHNEDGAPNPVSQIVVAHFDGQTAFAIAIADLRSGEVTVTAYNNRAERDAHMDHLALLLLRQRRLGNSPSDPPTTIEAPTGQQDFACAGA